MITIAGRVLMTSHLQRSEIAVAELGCAPVRHRPAPRVLIGGLGLGFTLRAALDVLPPTAQVVVAELNDAVVRWCRGPLAVLTDDALADPRVSVVVGDVTASIRTVAGDARLPRWDAVILDLYEGPGSIPDGRPDPLYGAPILRDTHRALSDGGVYAVWGESSEPAFEARLLRQGFAVRCERAGGKGPVHPVYVATKASGRS